MTKEVKKLSMDESELSVMLGNRRIRRWGRKLVEALVDGQPTSNKHAKRMREKFREAGITSKESLYKIADNTPGAYRAAEDLQFGNNSVLYTTAVASFIEKELRSELISRDVIKTLQLQPGRDDIDIPKGNNKTATAVSDDGSVSLDSYDYGSKNIQTDLYGVRDIITHELMQVTNVDLIADNLEEIGRAIAKKEDDLIQSELQDATDPTGSYGDNSNYNYLGSATSITFDNLIAGIHSAKGNKMDPTDIVAGVGVMSQLEQNDEFSDAMQYASRPSGDYIPETMTFRSLTVHESKQVADDSLFIVDRNRLGYFVEGSGVDMWDDRINGKAAFEVIGVKRFGVGLSLPTAVYGIHQKEDKPT